MDIANDIKWTVFKIKFAIHKNSLLRDWRGLIDDRINARLKQGDTLTIPCLPPPVLSPRQLDFAHIGFFMIRINARERYSTGDEYFLMSGPTHEDHVGSTMPGSGLPVWLSEGVDR